MGIDDFFLEKGDSALLRVYRWDSSLSLTFGYFQSYQRIKEEYPGYDVVRRSTGGGVVLHGTDWTFSLVVPKKEPIAGLSPLLFYQQLHTAIADFLKKYGLFCDLEEFSSCAPSKKDCSKMTPIINHCFKKASQYDLLLEGQKILGGALKRTKGSFLYQGSLDGEILLEKSSALQKIGMEEEVHQQREERSLLQKNRIKKILFLELGESLAAKVSIIKQEEESSLFAKKRALERYAQTAWNQKR